MAKQKSLLTSNHVNYLVFRYLQEAGFTHTAFTFVNESNVTQAPVDPNSVAPGTLITLLQKGMQFLELEANLEAQDGDLGADFKMLTPEELITHDIDGLRALLLGRNDDDKTGRKREGKAARERDKDRDKADRGNRQPNNVNANTNGGPSFPPPAPQPSLPTPRDGAGRGPGRGGGRGKNLGTSTTETIINNNNASHPNNKRDTGPAPMEEDTPNDANRHEFFTLVDTKAGEAELPADAVFELRGHQSEVNMCTWHPNDPSCLASASHEARIIDTRTTDEHKVLNHVREAGSESGQVAALSWNVSGDLLACGTMDGQVKVWSKEGKLVHSLPDRHSGIVFGVSWNKKGELLASCSSDTSVVVWDGKSGTAKTTYDPQSGPVMSVEWRNSSQLASSCERVMHLWKLGDKSPLRTWTDHQDVINTIKWDPNGSLLASCSDDATVKLWSPKSDQPAVTLSGHTAGVYACSWSPATSNNPGASIVTSGFDCKAKLWDVETGKETLSIPHDAVVYACDFSPSGRYLATTAQDTVYVWSIPEGKMVRYFKGDGLCTYACWNSAGDQIAVLFQGGKDINVMDFRREKELCDTGYLSAYSR